MEAVMISVFGLFALGVIGWEAWRERAKALNRIPADWQAALGRIANEQELGHFRHARQGILQACRRIEHHQDNARLAKYLHVRLAGLLAKDPIYTEVVRAIRSACAEEPAVSEVVLCLTLGDYLVEDIRQCMAIAESFGQIRLRDDGVDALVIPRPTPSM